MWDLMRAGRPETAREMFYQRTNRTPAVTGLWEQWARFELLQGKGVIRIKRSTDVESMKIARASV